VQVEIILRVCGRDRARLRGELANMKTSTDDLREKLIAAARDVLLLDGYGAATPKTISEKAGVTSEEFRKVFSSREDAVLAALDAHWNELTKFLDQAFDPGLPPLERLRRFYEGAYGFQDHHWNRLGCVVGCMLLRVGSAAAREEGAVRDRVARYLKELQSRIEPTLREAQAEGKIRQGDPGTMAWTLVHFIEGVLGMARIENDVHTLRGMLDRSLEFLGAEPRLLRD
jgi:TetR/AcrR family transcriptional repressor of nem operon